MKGFLRFIGIVEIILYAIGIIGWIMRVAFEGWLIFYFVIYLVFGPALGVLFLTVASLIEDKEALEEKVSRLEKQIKSQASTTKIVAKAVTESTGDSSIMEKANWLEINQKKIMNAYMRAAKRKGFTDELMKKKEVAMDELRAASYVENANIIANKFERFVENYIAEGRK